MKFFICVIIAALSVALTLSSIPAPAQNFSEIKPSPQQDAWQDLEFGVILHFGPNTFLNQEWGDGSADPRVFNPAQLDTDQWMRALKAAGARYVVFVAKHHDGFCLWPSSLTSYSVKSSPWENGKGDLVRRVADSARKFGLKFGVYLSPWDRHEPRYQNSAEYDRYYLGQMGELIQNYGELVEFWLDGAGSAGHVYNFPRYLEELRTYQPNTIVFADTGLLEYGDARWVGNESGTIPYENFNVIDRHGYLRWRPVEGDTPLHKAHWFWHPDDETSLKSLSELVATYDQTVGHGGQLMLGLAPDRSGLLPQADVERLQQFGAEIRRRYGHNLALQPHAATPAVDAAFDGDIDTFWSAPAGSHHASLQIEFRFPVTFDTTLTMEWLNDGQHIQRYKIEAMANGKWETLAEGQAVGHKKIDHFNPVTSSRVRLNILSSASQAHIREFQIFRGGETQK